MRADGLAPRRRYQLYECRFAGRDAPPFLLGQNALIGQPFGTYRMAMLSRFSCDSKVRYSRRERSRFDTAISIKCQSRTPSTT